MSRDLEFDNNSFPPIGNYYQPFRGEFDGMGHTISGYNVVALDGDDVGIFGYTVDAYIHDIKVDNVNIDTGKGFLTGGLVGVLRNGYLKNCSVSAIIHSDSGSVGGIVGANYGTIENVQLKERLMVVVQEPMEVANMALVEIAEKVELQEIMRG